MDNNQYQNNQPLNQLNPYSQPQNGQPYGQQPYGQQPYGQQPYGQQPVPQSNPNDSGSFGWAVLGFFIPLVGLILFLVWRKEKPKSAKKAGIGALVGFIVGIAFSVISNIMIAGLVAGM